MDSININDLINENNIDDFLNELSLDEIDLLIKELFSNEEES